MISNLIDSLAQAMEHLVEVVGLPGITLIALFENLFPPTPSEFLYPLAGKLVYDGHLNALGVILAGVAGSLAGSLFYYSVGYRLGETRTRAAIERWGRVRLWRVSLTFVTLDDYDRAVVLFGRWGGPLVLVARLIPLVHAVVSIPAGVVRMRLVPFVIYTALGSALWIAPLTLLGMWLGSQWERLMYWLNVYSNAWYILLGAWILTMIVRRARRIRNHSSPPDSAPSDDGAPT